MKRCLICDELKQLTEFHKASDKPDGYRNDCKLCRKLKIKVGSINPTKMRCYDCDKLKDKNTDNFNLSKNIFGFRRCCKECAKTHHKRQHLKRVYNITIEEYDELYEKQDGRCLICGSITKLVVDHDHKNGKVRGLLCNACNTGIGSLKENRKILLSAIKYLDKSNNLI